MAKDWKVTQRCTVDGVVHTSTFILPNTETGDVSSFATLLEGGYEITEINEAMSDMTKAETNVVGSNPVSFIGMYGAQNQSARIQGFGGKPIHFKNTISGDDIRNVLKLWTPYPLLPTEKPTSISLKASEVVL